MDDAEQRLFEAKVRTKLDDFYALGKRRAAGVNEVALSSAILQLITDIFENTYTMSSQKQDFGFDVLITPVGGEPFALNVDRNAARSSSKMLESFLRRTGVHSILTTDGAVWNMMSRPTGKMNRVTADEAPDAVIAFFTSLARLVVPRQGAKESARERLISFVWDPDVVTESEYAVIISALGDLVRAQGGLGVERVKEVGFQSPIGAGVGA